ncbi:beta-galactosidase [Salibacterium halotolerans]|uniref:Beta-galactosidase n=1 Tax=Salibacterium halotolerans TaxID=1884432 RepID=A0A1I5XSR3_9BACI|nr:beta-galactosidase [Salibacterium halotolerans]SFQ35011.1 beta-galactosidase [Salibacterium halotolerans]
MKAISDILPSISYGGDYNPEQWGEKVWYEDATLMRKAGVNLVSVGIFSWAVLEREEDRFDFTWLDKVMDILHEHGVGVCLATATASPPAWLSRKYPETLAVDDKGGPYSFGSRQHYSPNSPVYRRAVKKLVTKLAERYKDHPALKMWHINNEYGCHVSECYSSNSLEAFRTWLRRRYQTIDTLNEKWGTNFWSQRYNYFNDITFLNNTPTFPNPGQHLDYKRFMNDSLFELYMVEKKILRDITPDVPVFTNFMLEFKPLNYFSWAPELDVVTWDTYPDPREGTPEAHAMQHDLMRSLKHGQPFFVMEQVTSHVNWRDINVPKKPGEMRLWSYSAIARGSDGIMFFQWRQSRAGAEKFHGAMVPHSNDEQSRTYREVQQLGQELKQLDSLTGAVVPARAAIIFDWENWWAVEMEGKPHNKLSYLEQVKAYYHTFYKRNIAVDFVQPGGDLSSYDLVVAPMLYMVKDGEEKNLEQYVESGGTLLVSFFSGIADENDRIHLGHYPEPLRHILGMHVEEFVPMADGERNQLSAESKRYHCSTWSDVIHLDTAKAAATFDGDWYEGRPAVTMNHYGKGKAVYVGTAPEQTYIDELLAELIKERYLSAPALAPSHVEIVERTSEKGKHLVMVNHNQEIARVDLDPYASYIDLFTGSEVQQETVVGGMDIVILRETEQK